MMAYAQKFSGGYTIPIFRLTFFAGFLPILLRVSAATGTGARELSYSFSLVTETHGNRM